MQTVGLGEKLVGCDLVITGEGKLDGQSAYGKVPVGVARKAKRFGVPVVVLAGSITEDAEVLHQEGITAQFSIINAPMLLSEAMSKTGQLLECTTKEVLRLFIARNSFREHKTSKT